MHTPKSYQNLLAALAAVAKNGTMAPMRAIVVTVTRRFHRLVVMLSAALSGDRGPPVV